MTARLPILTFAGLAGAGLVTWVVLGRVEPSPRPGGRSDTPQKGHSDQRISPPVSGQTILGHAILTLESRPSVAAKIRYSVDLFGQKPVGSGVYLGQRSEQGVLFRLSLRLQLGNEPSSLLHVCDGRYLWMYRKLGKAETLSRVDLARVARALEESGDIESLDKIDRWPGLGGLPKLLRGLHATFDFTPVGETRLAGQLPVWKLRGEWKPEKLAGVPPEEEEPVKKGKPGDLGELPGHLPDHVLLFLGREDAFPYRIEYRRRETDRPQGSELPEGRPIVTMELFEVNLNAPVDTTVFIYNPGDLECADQTADFLKSLGLTP